MAAVPVTDPFRAAEDPALPGVAAALDAPAMARRLRECMPGASELLAVRLTRHKPGKRCVIEYDLAAAGPGNVTRIETLIGKIRAGHRPDSAYRLLERFWRAGFSADSADGICVPEPVACLDDLGMWLQRKVAGRPLAQLLAQATPLLMEKVAEAAHKVHGAGVPPKRRHAMADELRILHERLPGVAAQRPEWDGRIRRLLAACDRLGAGVPEPVPTGIHRDFYPDQVIVDGERLCLIDFDLYCAGDVGVDIGNFIAHITEQALRETGDAGAWRHLEEALRSRFIALAGARAAAAVDAYAILTLVRHIHLSTLFADRRRLTPVLLEMCEARLAPWS